MKNNKTNKTKKSGKAKAITALVLSAIMLAGGVVVGYGAGTRWTYKRGNVQTVTSGEEGETQISEAESVMQLSKGENHGIKCNTRALKTAEYQEYEIDAQSVDSAHVATVTLANHDEATDKSITLSAEFTESWAINQGWKASDYIAFSSTTVQSGEEFTITCLQPFASPITIKATANGIVSANDGSKAYCTVTADFIRRIEKINLYLGSTDLNDRTIWSKTLQEGRGVTAEIYANLESYAWQNFSVQGAPDILFIDTYVDDNSYLSDGTKTESFKDFELVLTDGSEPQWASAEVWGNDLEDSYDYDLVSGSDYPIYFGNGRTHYDDRIVCYLDERITYFAGGTYSKVMENYQEDMVTSSLWIRFTGVTSGITYTFRADFLVNPQYLYISAKSPSFDSNTSGGIIF